MHLHPRLRRSIVTFALIMAAGCGSSSEPTPTPDSSVGRDTAPTPADTRIAAPDGPTASDVMVVTADTTTVDAAVMNDAAADTNVMALDGPARGIDAGKTGLDTSVSEASGGNVDTSSRQDVGGNATDAGGQPDGPSDAGSLADGTTAAADAGFVPGPATAAAVNNGTAGQFSLSDGTWKVFYFDAVAGQVYAVSGLSGIVHGYVSTSASVSPANYQFVTNTDGNLSFTAPAAQRYYIAVAVSGGGASGSFQVADGGTLTALGSTVLTLTAPDLDNTYFYRFPITAGHGYTFTATGPIQPNVSIAVSPRAERSGNGQLSYTLWGMGGSLPFTNQDIPAASVAISYSGFYYFLVRVTAAITLTVTITESP
jgi:hypothetical protein